VAAALLLAGCATAARGGMPPSPVELRLEPNRWATVTRMEQRGSLLVEFAPRGESAERWTRLVSVQVYPDDRVPYPGVRWAAAQCHAVLVDVCPGATWTTLKEELNDLTYEWRVAGCPSQPDQHEVGRIMREGSTWARVTFTVKGVMDAATREEWLRRLSEARFVPPGP
jgi:hypothetical protein